MKRKRSKSKIVKQIALGAVLFGAALGFSGCGSSSDPVVTQTGPTTPLPVASSAPRFQGVCSVGVAGATGVRLNWAPALDDQDAASNVAYQVFASTTSGGQNFTSPLFTTPAGATSTTVTTANFPSIAAGTEVFFTVRAVDSGGNVDSNNVEVRVTPTTNVFFVDATAGAGTGTQASPFNTIQAGVDAAEAAGGGTVLVAQGTYNERVLADGAVSTINILGGFPSFTGGADEATLLASRDPETNVTTIDGSTLLLAAPVGLVEVNNGGSNTLIDGFTIIDSPDDNVRAVDSRIQVSCCSLEGSALTPSSGIQADTSTNTNVQNVWVVGNEFSGVNDGVRIGGATASFRFLANEIQDTTDDGVEVSSDLLANDTILIPSGQTTQIQIEGNSVTRVGTGFDLDFEPEATGVAGNLDIDFVGNDVFSFDQSGDGIEIHDFTFVGQGGSSNLLISANRFSGISSSMLDMNFTSTDPNNVPDGRADILIENNVMINVEDGSGAVDVDDLSVAANSQTNFTFRNNFTSNTEGDSVEISDEAGPNPGDHDNGVINLVFDGNRDEANDDDIYDVDVDVPHGGSILFDFKNNLSVGSQGSYELDSDDALGTAGAGGLTSTRRMLVMNNTLNSSDEDMELDFGPAGGLAELIVFNNNVITGDGAEDIFEIDLAGSAAFDGDVDVIIANNLSPASDEDFVDINNTGFDGEPGNANIYIGRNTHKVVEDSSADNMELSIPDSALMLIETNELGPGADSSSDGIELGIGASDSNGPSVLIQNNFIAYSDDDGIELRSGARNLPEIVNNTIVRGGEGSSNDFGIDVSSGENFSQLFVQNCIVTENARDLDTNTLIQPVFSLIGDMDPLMGLGNFVGDPNFALQGGPLDLEEQFSPFPNSITRDAGNPAARYNDPDGTRNDVGATGGPASALIGFQADQTVVPLVTIGMRPFADLATGNRLLSAASPVTLVFTTELDAATVSASSIAFSSGGTAIGGALNVDGRRVTFTPAGGFTPGSVVTVNVSGLSDTNGTALAYARTLEFGVEPAAVAETGANDSTGTASALTTPTFRVNGTQGGGDVTDFYSISALAGQRLSATIFSDRTGGGGASNYRLTILDTDGTTVLTQNADTFGAAGEVDPYVNFVFDADGTYFVLVEDENASAGGVTYELEGILR